MLKPGRHIRAAVWSRRSKEQERLARRLDRDLMRAEDLLDRGKNAEVLALLGDLPKPPWSDASFHLRAGDLHLGVEELEKAESHFLRALELDARSADALHGIGLVKQINNDRDAMIEAWLKVRELDLLEPPLPWALSTDEFTEIAEASFEEIPEHIRERLENLPIVVVEYPGEDLILEGIDPRTLGLITGVPYAEKMMNAPALDCVHLYQRNIERMAHNREEVAREIRITVLHETAHFFGLDDDDLDEIGLG